MENSTPQTLAPIPAASVQPGASNDTRTIVTVLCLLFLFPIGLILMWFWSEWKLWIKLLITILPVALILFAIISVFTIFNFVYPRILFNKIPNLNDAEKVCMTKCYRNKDQEKCLLSCLPPETLTGTPNPSAPSSSSQLNTSNWKTYTNTVYNFTLKYPSDRLESCNPKPTSDGIKLWMAPFDCPVAHDAPYEIAIIAMNKENYREYKTPFSTETITISGINSTKKVYKYTNEDGPLANFREGTELVIPQNNNVIKIQFLGDSSEKKNLFDQILSTFQFTK